MVHLLLCKEDEFNIRLYFLRKCLKENNRENQIYDTEMIDFLILYANCISYLVVHLCYVSICYVHLIEFYIKKHTIRSYYKRFFLIYCREKMSIYKKKLPQYPMIFY